MILLQLNEYLILGSSITDWLQAVGAIFAIVAIIWGFSQLNKDSKDKQRQIDSLSALGNTIGHSIEYNGVVTELFFTDLDNNIYSQNISGNHLVSDLRTSFLQISDPVVVKFNSDETEN